jgi:hypothetical protein
MKFLLFFYCLLFELAYFKDVVCNQTLSGLFIFVRADGFTLGVARKIFSE